MMAPAAQTREVLSFGPFSLVAAERLLTRDGAAVELGPRALDTLLALLSRPNQPIDKRELMALVWPGLTVEEGSLRFHIASLRKALGDGKDGARYIATEAGRGYCFVAPIARSADSDAPPPPALLAEAPRVNLPSRLMRMIGRGEAVALLARRLAGERFVTIVGAGGVGKTTVAVAIGHDLIAAFTGAVLFVDLGALSDRRLVATSLAAMLGLAVQSDDPTPGLIAYLKDRRALVILDNCEHLIEAAADLAARIFIAAPKVHILATSREALRVEGEHVHRLASLSFAPDDPQLPAAAALEFPASQLFVERAEASGARLELSEADATIVAQICRKLDGVPLAIELAAGRVEAYGLRQTAALLDQRLTLLWEGRRTAPPRQKTLHATLDWSFGLLSDSERLALRRLAVFVGDFTLDAAVAVATGPAVDAAVVFEAIDNLVAKSMVATRPLGAMMRYRLLDTTRAYALEIAIDEAARAELAARHAAYYRQWLEQTGAEWPTLSNAAERAPHLAGLANVRAALEWCFGAEGDPAIGVALASAAAPVFLAMSLLTECVRWSERALRALDEATRGGEAEMHLQAALGMSLMFTRGMSEAARVALDRSLALAEALGDDLNQLALLGPLHMFHVRVGDFKTALRNARRSVAVSQAVGDAEAIALAHSLLGIVLHLVGDLRGARRALEAAVQHGPGARRTRSLYLGFDHHNWAGIALARTLWLQGHPVQAVEQARRAVMDAAGMDHPVTLSIALNWAISVFFWTGDLISAEQHIDWFVAHAESHSLGPYFAVGRGHRGELAVRRGDARSGVEILQACLADLHAAHYELLTSAFNLALIHGLAATGRFAEGLAKADEAIRLTEANGDLSYLPELLRLKGGLLLALHAPGDSDAEGEICLTQSLDLSRRQAASAWELRAAVDLAALWKARGRAEAAEALLRPVYGRFTEGFDTADLQGARRVLAQLG